jgi:hypothetical protein
VTITVSDFRASFPAYADPTVYPDTQVQFYIDFAYLMLRPERWGTVIDQGASLFVAHFLSTDALAKAAGIGGVPGTGVGVVDAGTIDKVTFGKNVDAVMEPDAGHWGMTIYGLQFLRLARMMGAGPIQVGWETDQYLSLYNGAWPGPFLGPW